MSESKVDCPFCKRPPGGFHADSCSRSSKQVKARKR